VPPFCKEAAPATAPTPARHRPVYDPYTARRRRAPEWLVDYTTALVTGDIVAAVTAACVAVALTGPV
jgi:hypothetical protein